MDLDRAIERAMRDPETRVRIYLLFNVGLIVVDITIALGLVFLFYKLRGLY